MPAGKMYRFRKKIPKATKKYVNRAISKRSETKRVTIGSTLRTGCEPVSGAPVSLEFTGIAGGSLANQRIGDRISLSSIEADLVFEKRSTTDLSNICRVIVYSPKDPSQEMSTIQVQGYPDLSKFVILYDKVFSLNSTSDQTKTLSFRKRFPKGRHVEYDGTTATSGTKGRVWLYAVSDSSTTVAPKVTYKLRTFYKDF